VSRAFIGFASCGCPVAAMVLGYSSKREVRATLKEWAGQGYRIEQMTTDKARALPGFLDCSHRDPKHRATSVDEIDSLMELSEPGGDE
jgi:hypothetical protein